MLKTYEKEKKIALKAVSMAANLCQDVSTQLQTHVLKKEDKSPVTIADLGSQALICHLIKEHFPNDLIVAEEDSGLLTKAENTDLKEKTLDHINKIDPSFNTSMMLKAIDQGNHDGSSNRYWTLDPIDGTKGFIRKEQYAISLALIENNELVLGALCCPNLTFNEKGIVYTGGVFLAQKGQGAFRKPLKEEAFLTKIQVSSRIDNSKLRLCESVEKAHSSHDDLQKIIELLKTTEQSVRIDSQAKYAAVAQAEAEAYLRLPRDTVYREKIWDHGAGIIIVEEAGGKVTDIYGNKLDFSTGRTFKNNLGVVVSNGFCHDSLINAIADVIKKN